MGCIGDGWHRIGTNTKVLVKDRVIVECMIRDMDGNWNPAHVVRWNFMWHRYERVCMVTLAALRSGINRSTMTVTCGL